MIRNYDELIICITKIEKQIPKLKAEQQRHIYNLNFGKAKIVLLKQQFLELQILSYIEYYQEKIKNNYLESKLYSPKLSSLKKSYQTKTIANDLVYCLKELIMEYDELQKDLWIFSALSLHHALAIKEKIRNLIFTMEEIYLELSNVILIPNTKINEEQKIHYNLIVDFFHHYYTSQIENLREELMSKKSGLKFIQSLKMSVNPITTKMIQFEIEIKDGIKEITTQLDSILTKTECYEKLSKILHKAIFN
jgi:hypothetical protein